MRPTPRRSGTPSVCASPAEERTARPVSLYNPSPLPPEPRVRARECVWCSDPATQTCVLTDGDGGADGSVGEPGACERARRSVRRLTAVLVLTAALTCQEPSANRSM